MLQMVGIVMAGAAVGGGLRFLITRFPFEATHHQSFPFGTLAVNVLGSLLVGLVLASFTDHTHSNWRLLLATGFCGGFTTFSAFAFESMAYWNAGRLVPMLANIFLNNVLSFAALLGAVWMRQNSNL